MSCTTLLPLAIVAMAWGLAAENQVPSAQELQAQLNASIVRRDPSFTIPPGVYNFSSANLIIFEATNLRIVGDGVMLWFQSTTGVNITNCDTLYVRGLSINYTAMGHSNRGVQGITYSLLNSSNVVSEDITIYQAPYFSVTAFNGGGGHVFRRFSLPTGFAPPGRNAYPHQRDAFHVTDLRQGVTLEDSSGGYCGDDFFNSHNTIMLVLKVESATSLLMINPHVVGMWQNGKIKNTVYGSNCVLENLRRGDSVSFYGWPQNVATAQTPRPLGAVSSVASSPIPVGDNATLAAAEALGKQIEATRGTVSFEATDVWRVEFAAAVDTEVAVGTLVNLDSFSTPGTVIRNNTFSTTRYHLGRFKSNGGAIVNNTFLPPGNQLELSPLLQYFEGNLPVVRDVVVSGNTVVLNGGKPGAPVPDPFYCGPVSMPQINCSHDTPFAVNMTVSGNNVTQLGEH